MSLIETGSIRFWSIKSSSWLNRGKIYFSRRFYGVLCYFVIVYNCLETNVITSVISFVIPKCIIKIIKFLFKQWRRNNSNYCIKFRFFFSINSVLSVFAREHKIPHTVTYMNDFIQWRRNVGAVGLVHPGCQALRGDNLWSLT